MGLNFFCPLWKVQACVLKRMIEAQRCKATAFFHSVSVDIWFSEQLRWICIVLFCEMIEDMDSWAKYSILCSIRSNTAKNVQSKCRDDSESCLPCFSARLNRDVLCLLLQTRHKLIMRIIIRVSHKLGSVCTNMGKHNLPANNLGSITVPHK